MQLYNFFRSGPSRRLPIALHLKGLAYHDQPVDLRTEEHLAPAFRKLNPQGLVPAVLHDGRALIQTPAILEWLEERHPSPPLLPADADDRARVRAMATIVGCDIHPLNNRRVLEYLRKRHSLDEPAIQAWCATWITAGFDAIEAVLTAGSQRGRYSFGDTPTLADVYLVPQVESARRFGVDVGRWPSIAAVDAECANLEPFRLAAPALQRDAVERHSKG